MINFMLSIGMARCQNQETPQCTTKSVMRSPTRIRYTNIYGVLEKLTAASLICDCHTYRQ